MGEGHPALNCNPPLSKNEEGKSFFLPQHCNPPLSKKKENFSYICI